MSKHSVAGQGKCYPTAMSWNNLTLDSANGWSNHVSYPAARVRSNAQLTNVAELEGYLDYSGTSLSAVGITKIGFGLPSGCFDTSAPHSIGGRCYDSSVNSLGVCEVLIDTSGNVLAAVLPSGTTHVYFGDMYPTA